ncbi:hypothetical protein T484DRAFT_2280134 [Baffinella frigidus]|nr:hypothetical protein T484DRAFT_2280134 [Cryptophyta sp. CCMP2293]
MWETLHGSPAATAGAAGQRKGPSALPSGGGGDQTGGAREEARQNSPDVRSPATPRTPGVGVAQWMGVGASSGAKIQHLQARVDAKRSSLGSSLGETSVPHPPGHVAAMPSPRISSSGGVALPAAPLPAAAAAAGGGVAAAAPAGARPPPSGTPPLRGAGGINPDRPAVQSGPPRAVPLLNLAKVPPPWQALGDAPPTARARPAPAPAPLAPARGEAAPAAHQTRAETPRGAATPRGGAGNYFAAQQAPRQSGVASGQQASPQQALPQRASPQRAPLPWYLQPASEVSQAQAQARPPPQVAARPLRPEHQQHQHPQHQHHLQQQYQQQQQQRRHQSPQQQPSPGPGVAWHSPTQYLASPSHSLAAAPQHAAVPPHSVRVSGGTPQHYSGGTPPVHYSGHNSPADSAMRASLSTQASYTPRVQTPAGGQHHIPGILKTPRTSSAPSPASAAASAPTPVDYRGYATPPTPVDYRGYATPPAHSYGVMPAAAAATPRAAAAAHAQGRAGSMTPRAGLTTPLGGAPSGPVALTPRGGGASTPRARSAATVAYSVAVDAQADRITTPRQRPIPATEARSSYISFC